VPATATTPALELDPDRQSTLDGILGHEAIRGYLREAIANGSLPQAILFTGPSGVGKKTLAWALAKEIVTNSGEHPSGSGKISRGTHPDVRLLGNVGRISGQISVDEIRDLIEWAPVYPLEAPNKIAIITPADKLNLSAANALLKLLEEPPSHFILILITSDLSALLPTIRSRCTVLPLEGVPISELLPWLIGRAHADPEKLQLAADLAEGRPGFALSLLEGKGLENRKAILKELLTLKAHGFASVFGVAERLTTADLPQTLKTLLLLLRDALSLSLGVETILNRDLLSDLRPLVEGSSPRGILEAATLVESGVRESSELYNAQSKSHFMEVLIIGIGRELRKI